MSDICFVDTETLGLDLDAPVWEFAAVRRGEYGDPIAEVEIQIHHDPTGWLDDFPERFARDYHARYNETTAWSESDAARLIHAFTDGAHIVGAVPSFDTERLAKLLRRNGLEPGWHYHLQDVETLVLGYLHGVAARAIDEARMRGEQPDPALVNRRTALPTKSDELSAAVGVNPADYARHTAMGDVRWTGCDTWIGAPAAAELPNSFVAVTDVHGRVHAHCCSTDCLMHWAAAHSLPNTEVSNDG